MAAEAAHGDWQLLIETDEFMPSTMNRPNQRI